ncbi:MAG: alanine--glyoxylate aminotransferase family protein [Candidatus Portiera sp.]|nr:alanine--glyoxylate aminotransferase family protein [Portiera sp.]
MNKQATPPQSFYPPSRRLMGPGPTDISPRVLAAMSRPTLGHLDPDFIDMTEDLKQMLQQAFKTENSYTIPLSSPASAAMEAAIINILEPGEKIIVCRNGVFGMRMSDIIERAGGEVVAVDDEWGKTIDLQKVEDAIKQHPDAIALAFVYAETSTGVRSDAAALAKMARTADMLSIVDCVTALGGIDLRVDEWGLDLVYSGSQKCLAAPPGLAPMTINERALKKIASRSTKVQSWFLDFNLLGGYFQGSDANKGGSKKRAYHHTAPINSLYALHESLVVLLEEGLDASFKRHQLMHLALEAGLSAMGIELTVDKEWRLPQLNSVGLPDSVDDAAVRSHLLKEHSLEIGAGLGASAGKIWRIGLMGYGARQENVFHCLTALEDALANQGFVLTAGKALPAARKVLTNK